MAGHYVNGVRGCRGKAEKRASWKIVVKKAKVHQGLQR
jgi:hypothetical protein